MRAEVIRRIEKALEPANRVSTSTTCTTGSQPTMSDSESSESCDEFLQVEMNAKRTYDHPLSQTEKHHKAHNLASAEIASLRQEVARYKAREEEHAKDHDLAATKILSLQREVVQDQARHQDVVSGCELQIKALSKALEDSRKENAGLKRKADALEDENRELRCKLAKPEDSNGFSSMCENAFKSMLCVRTSRN